MEFDQNQKVSMIKDIDHQQAKIGAVSKLLISLATSNIL